MPNHLYIITASLRSIKAEGEWPKDFYVWAPDPTAAINSLADSHPLYKPSLIVIKDDNQVVIP